LLYDIDVFHIFSPAAPALAQAPAAADVFFTDVFFVAGVATDIGFTEFIHVGTHCPILEIAFAVAELVFTGVVAFVGATDIGFTEDMPQKLFQIPEFHIEDTEDLDDDDFELEELQPEDFAIFFEN
jgi:hypothetical protein